MENIKTEFELFQRKIALALTKAISNSNMSMVEIEKLGELDEGEASLIITSLLKGDEVTTKDIFKVLLGCKLQKTASFSFPQNIKK